MYTRGRLIIQAYGKCLASRSDKHHINEGGGSDRWRMPRLVIRPSLLVFLLTESSLWSYGIWIYNYLCNHHQGREFEPRSWQGVLDITLFDKVCQWLTTGQWFSAVSSNNKTDRHNITEILLKVSLNTITENWVKFVKLF